MNKQLAKQRKPWITVAVVCAVGVIAVVVLATISFSRETSPTQPAASDTGFRDFSFSATNVRTPTYSASQSKLWFNDGSWWGSFFDRSAGEHRIYRYNSDTRTWTDAGTDIDERDASKADTLWDGTHLYVVSAGPDSSITDQSARILRYSYDAAAKKYSLDSGFPVTITSGGMETIVLAKDTSDKLWVTYTQDNRVYVSHTLDDDLTWAKPFVLPGQGTTVDPDDISSIIAFDSQIGVMWSNQADKAIYFATHRDGDDPDSWQAATALRPSQDLSGTLSEPNIADDHINLKADSSGRVFAAVKTSLNESSSADPETPLNVLLVRDEDAKWTDYTFDTENDQHTRPMVLLDEEHRELYMFATAPCCSGGTIYYKRTSLDNISFPEGTGTPFIQSATSKNIDSATSTKQNLDSTTGLLVLASDTTSGYYLHNTINLDGTTPSSAQPSE
jgi:hypothetical protein